jgi:predicted nucleic acid-binding protein
MFIDTSGWFVVFDSGDVHHEKARDYYESNNRLVTHSYVLAEFVALSEARKKHRIEMLTFLSKLLQDSQIQIIWVDESLTTRSLQLLRSRTDKVWSLCDAVSFVVMQDMDLIDALTTDRDFEQAGFVRLLKA